MALSARKEIPGMFDGPIAPVTFKLALPILLSSVLQLVYGIVDTYFISRIDPTSTALLSGTGLMFPVFFLFMAVGSSVCVGLSSVVGRVIGERRMEVEQYVMSTGFALGVLIAVPALIIGLAFGHQFVHLLAGSRMSDEAINYGTQFFRSLLPGLVIMVLGQTFMGILQGEGRTGIIATAMVASTVVNTLLDPLFIFVLDMKVAGAGLATTVATTVASAYVLGAFVRGKTTVPFVFSLRKVRLTMAREVVRIGFPQFLSMASMAISFMLLNKVVGDISQGAMNSWTLAGRFNDLVLIPSFAVAGATVPMIAQNYGRNNLSRLRSIYNRNILIAVGMVLCGALLYMAIAPMLFTMISDVPEVVHDAVRQVRLLALTFIGISVAIISAATFQAIGKPMAALVLSLLRMGVIAVPLAFFFVYYAHMGMDGVFLGMGASSVLVLPIAYGMVRGRLSRLAFRSVVERTAPLVPSVENF